MSVLGQIVSLKREKRVKQIKLFLQYLDNHHTGEWRRKILRLDFEVPFQRNLVADYFSSDRVNIFLSGDFPDLHPKGKTKIHKEDWKYYDLISRLQCVCAASRNWKWYFKCAAECDRILGIAHPRMYTKVLKGGEYSCGRVVKTESTAATIRGLLGK